MRLDKFISESTHLTRSLAKKTLKSGAVSCNGASIKDPTYKVKKEDQIELDGVPLLLVGTRYIMLNKPLGTICSTIDEEYPSVLTLLDVTKPQELHIAGRLDVDTTGLVLITNDGQWSHKITSPKKECGKVYLVTLADDIDTSLIDLFANGVQLRGESELTKPAQLEIIDSHHARLVISEGKYHQVKRMFAAAGNRVVKLHREQIGSIALDQDMPLGAWRYLTEHEITSVK